jgi:hypothetical protein
MPVAESSPLPTPEDKLFLPCRSCTNVGGPLHPYRSDSAFATAINRASQPKSALVGVAVGSIAK